MKPASQLCVCEYYYYDYYYFIFVIISAKWTKWMAEIMRLFDVCLSVCLCEAAGQWELNANSSKTVKATDFKFDTGLPRDSPDMTPENSPKRGRG